jgi:hypothetical protein
MNINFTQFIFALFCVIISTDATGQNIDLNKSNIGINFGSELDLTSIGFTVETPFLDDYGEISFSLIQDASPLYKFTVLYKYYADIELDDLPNLRYYYGLGPSIVISNDNINYGSAASAGLDYSFDEIPLIIGAEIKPAYYVGDGPYDGLYFAQFGLFGKFNLAKQKAK